MLNPRLMSSNMLWSHLPQETSRPISGMSMVSVNQFTEVIMIGGYNGTSFLSDIWKYNLSNNSFKLIGKLHRAKGDTTAFLVHGISCN